MFSTSSLFGLAVDTGLNSVCGRISGRRRQRGERSKKIFMQLNPNDYIGKPVNARQGQPFVPFDDRGYTVIEVLPQLNGKPWDEVALGYVHALRPSQLRVVQDSAQLDSENWRVTVWLESDGLTIHCIEQEVEVGLPQGCPHGAGLDAALQYGLNSAQLEWYNKPGMECFDSVGDGPSHYKLADDGTKTPFPTEIKGVWVEGV